MKLYHGTSLDYRKNILRDGISASESDKRGEDVEAIREAVVYGFTDWKDAWNFAIDWHGSDVLVVEFDTEDYDYIEDPEYADCDMITGKAYAVFGDNIECKHYIDSNEYYN